MKQKCLHRMSLSSVVCMSCDGPFSPPILGFSIPYLYPYVSCASGCVSRYRSVSLLNNFNFNWSELCLVDSHIGVTCSQRTGTVSNGLFEHLYSPTVGSQRSRQLWYATQSHHGISNSPFTWPSNRWFRKDYLSCPLRRTSWRYAQKDNAGRRLI